jgi:hypothetical protein
MAHINLANKFVAVLICSETWVKVRPCSSPFIHARAVVTRQPRVSIGGGGRFWADAIFQSKTKSPAANTQRVFVFS